MAGTGSEKSLRVAATVQHLQQVYAGDGDQVPVPQFILLGPQSIGKTRTLSCIAACKLGGAEKQGTGTRCPVIYRFVKAEEVRFKVGTGVADMRDVTQDDVPVYLTEHMNTLGKDENEMCARPGFSLDPVWVQVEGPKVPCVSIVDLPGIKKANSDKAEFITACNKRIVEMYQHFLKDANTVPVVLIQFETSLDPGETNATVNNFLSDSGLQGGHCSKAIVFVTRLDAVKAQVGESHIKDLLRHLTAKKFTAERVVMATLRPELLSSDSSLQCRTSESNEYFRATRQSLESNHLQPWLQERELASLSCKFGFSPLIDVMQNDLATSLVRNRGKIETWLMEKLQQEVERGEELCARVDPLDHTALRFKIMEYVNLYSTALKAVTSRDDATEFKEAWSDLQKRYEKQFGMSEVEMHDLLFKTSSRTFEEEAEAMRQSPGNSVNETWLLCEEVQDAIDSKAQGMPASQDLQLKLGGASAVRRLLERQCMAFMLKELKSFTNEELQDLRGSALNPSRVVEENLHHLVRKMVERMLPTEKQITMSCFWCKEIYLFQARIVRDIFRDAVPLLKEFPKLRDFVDNCIMLRYKDEIESISNDAAGRIQHLSRLSFQILDVDGIVKMETLAVATLGAIFGEPQEATGLISMIKRAVVEHPDLTKTIVDKGLDVLAPEFPEFLKPLLRKITQHMQESIQPGPEGCPEADAHSDSELQLAMELVREVPSSALDKKHISCPGRVRSQADELNHTAHSVARFNLAKIWQESKMVILGLFDIHAPRIPESIAKALQLLPGLLFDNHSKLLSKLTGVDSEKDLADIEEAAARLQKVCNDVSSFMDSYGDKSSLFDFRERVRHAGAVHSALVAALKRLGSADEEREEENGEDGGSWPLDNLLGQFHQDLEAKIARPCFGSSGLSDKKMKPHSKDDDMWRLKVENQNRRRQIEQLEHEKLRMMQENANKDLQVQELKEEAHRLRTLQASREQELYEVINVEREKMKKLSHEIQRLQEVEEQKRHAEAEEEARKKEEVRREEVEESKRKAEVEEEARRKDEAKKRQEEEAEETPRHQEDEEGRKKHKAATHRKEEGKKDKPLATVPGFPLSRPLGEAASSSEGTRAG